MDIKTLKQLAYLHTGTPEDYQAPERAFYLAAERLYEDLSANRIPLGLGKVRMVRFERLYEADCTLRENNLKIAKLWHHIEAPAREYSKNPSIETADKFYAAVYNLSNDWRLKR